MQSPGQVRKLITIHTDGACQGNPGPGGWGARLEYGKLVKEIKGGEPATTNNRMELQAAIQALKALKEPCEINFYTDSEYLRQGITSWIAGWRRKGWKTREGLPVKNVDLWQELDAATNGHVIHWKWVKGHAGNAHNETCDRLAIEGLSLEKRKYTQAQLRELVASFKAGQ